MKNFEKKKDRYRRRMTYLENHLGFKKFIHISNKILSFSVFILYGILLNHLLLAKDILLAKAIIVPLDAFIILSVFRLMVNRSRPYEVYGVAPAIDKKTKGKSFPSRHVFSVMMIAITCLYTAPSIWWGVALLFIGVFIAVIRVVSGVHFVSDVIAGTVFAVLAGVIGFLVF